MDPLFGFTWVKVARGGHAIPCPWTLVAFHYSDIWIEISKSGSGSGSASVHLAAAVGQT